MAVAIVTTLVAIQLHLNLAILQQQHGTLVQESVTSNKGAQDGAM